MAEDSLTVAGAQTGDNVRTSRKVYLGKDVHEEYVIPDVPWTLTGAYAYGDIFYGIAGVGTNGILAGLYRPAAGSPDIVVRRVSVGYFNEGSASQNTIAMTRTAAFPPGSSAVAKANIAKKDSTWPTPNGDIYAKPTGVTMSAGELSAAVPLLLKPNTALAQSLFTRDMTQEAEPFVLTTDEALVVFLRDNVGTTTELYSFSFEWQEFLP